MKLLAQYDIDDAGVISVEDVGLVDDGILGDSRLQALIYDDKRVQMINREVLGYWSLDIT